MDSPGIFHRLGRAWGFPRIPEYRPRVENHATYVRYELDLQPSVLDDIGDDLGWLADLSSPDEWAITADDDGEPTNVVGDGQLDQLARGKAVHPVARSFFSTLELQSKIRSCTGCYLDLGEFVVPVVGASGVLCHFLSDQQWVRHWLVYCGQGAEQGTVITTDRPYGFDTTGWFEEEVPTEFDPSNPASGDVCADSFEEFLYRLWVENELFFSTVEGESAVDQRVLDYGNRLRQRN